jgi:hypothetical protein
LIVALGKLPIEGSQLSNRDFSWGRIGL